MTSNTQIDLSGWAIADRNKRRTVLSGLDLAPGETARFSLDGSGAQLRNKGGIITLLTPKGMKVHGVSYTRDEARQQGWTIAF